MSHTQFRAPKRERSPTPPIGNLSQQANSGSKRIAPIPDSCAKGVPGFAAARKAWVREEAEKLKALGLTITRTFLRDDGLVFDWESASPVWTDTLLPSSAAQKRPHVAVDNGMSMEVSSNLLNNEEVRAPDTEVTEPNELEEMAIQYLSRYLRTFDENRSALSDAYDENATFSYCIHDIIAPNSLAGVFTSSTELQRFAPRRGSRNLLKPGSGKNISLGKSEILSTLESLGPHKFCASSPAAVDYDVLNLPGTPLVLLICKGNVVDERQSRQYRLSVHQSFVLRKRVDHCAEDSAPNAKRWPLDALCHQMSIRDLSLIPAAD